ncbi:MAG TPA: glycine zipper 2TM domain-containing protein [Gemmatimonadales bacterium]|nr:glycine zipper 2TM domain-containing protein [Gemmatimonadales bacterium]
MPTRPIALLVTLTLIAAACGGDKPLEQDQATGLHDSLVPIADEPMLPDTTPPAPPETVIVERPAPSPARPRPTPPPVATTRPERNDPPPAPTPAPVTATPVLASGTAIRTTMMDSVHSRYNNVGDPVRVRVATDYTDGNGKVVIPAGSVITMSITDIKPAANRDAAGTLVLSARSIMIDGESYPLTARSTDFEYELRARGIGTGEVAKTGAGAVAGGIIGRVIGGKKGTVIGAIGGAAAGAAVASSTADRDIIVHAGKAMTITLRDEFSRTT